MVPDQARGEIALRPAAAGDMATLNALIAHSARALSRGFYTDAQIEAAVAHVFGVDSELVGDGSYLVAEDAGAIVGCGGWSRRRTLFGGDSFAGRASGLLDPHVDAARIRAFFVAPGHARRGIGSRLLRACEASAADAGFTRSTLMATMPGVPLYRAHGYAPDEEVALLLGGVTVPFVSMSKRIVA